MRIHILGICGTFMAGVAQVAVALGHEVSGSDRQYVPPMSDQLEGAGVRLCPAGYRTENLDPAPDLVLVGNALIRGNPELEAVLDRRLSYESAPAWLGQTVLRSRRVIAVAGTHGKTTTSALLAYLLDQAGADPGFLVGGVPLDFPVSARLGHGRWFVIEADEYDTAFFDRRPKFLHYRPWITVLNNLEYDHADLYPDLASLETVFHELVRSLPAAGRIIVNGADPALARVLARGTRTPVTHCLAGPGAWRAQALDEAASRFRVIHPDGELGPLCWNLRGTHNLSNAVAALAAAWAAGVDPTRLAPALEHFRGVRRRLEVVAEGGGVRIYDDFAHHPTAIAATLGALRAEDPSGRLITVFEPRSNSMKRGVYGATLAAAFRPTDILYAYDPGLDWKIGDVLGPKARVFCEPREILAALKDEVRVGDRVVFLSNGDFAGLRDRLFSELRAFLPNGVSH
jgi:UDP-N-acetylmuramate: L-alanyl-gamma-D-glutamyl-meso-diaminopimelate ligase